MRFSIVTAITLFSLIGVALSVFSLLTHASLVSSSFCDINATFDCDVVNKGVYSTIFGIPVALLGVIGYGFMFVASVLKRRQPTDRSITWILFGSAVGAFIFSLYLTSLEAFVLQTWCILCLGSQATIFILLMLITFLLRNERKPT